MFRIFLVRHGQDQDNASGILNGHRDEPLTEVGVAQAHEIAAKVREGGVTFDKIYSSPLQRAYKTAEIIAEAMSLPKPEVLPHLIERDFGVMTGQPIAQIEALCAPDILKTDTITYFLKPVGAETFPQLLKRAQNVLSLIEARHTAGNLLLATHGDLGKMLYAAYYNLGWLDVLKAFHFGNSDILELSPASQPHQTHLHKTTQYNV